MTLKVILCQRFGESIGDLILGIDREDLDETLSHMFTKMMVTHIDVIGNLILGINREDLDETLSHMFTKMMVTHIDVIGPRTKLGQPCQIEGTRVVFKNLAIHIRFSAKNLETLLPHFLQ